MKLSKLMPTWIKYPISVLLNEAGKFPLPIVLAHVRKAYADSKPASQEHRIQAQRCCHQEVYAYLDGKYGYLLDTAAKVSREGTYREAFPIWVFWWQGEKNAPPLVRACISSIRRHAAGHPICVVDEQNFRDFVEIPENILEKVRWGSISLTHFSDILRMNLIARHGGLWLDATIFCTQDIAGPWFEQPIFTVRNPGRDPWNISNWEWSGFAIYGWKGEPLFCMMRDLFNAYWADHDKLIDYFLIDCAMRLVYDHCQCVRDVIDRIPENNSRIYYFQQSFGNPAEDEKYDWRQGRETWLYKLTWKTEYPLKTADGRDTVYALWLAANTEGKAGVP